MEKFGGIAFSTPRFRKTRRKKWRRGNPLAPFLKRAGPESLNRIQTKEQHAKRMARLFAFVTLDFAELVERMHFARAEAVGRKDGKMIQPAVEVFVGRQIIGVAVTRERFAVGVFAGENRGLCFFTFWTLEASSENAHEIPSRIFRHWQRGGDQWQHRGVER